jgi:energy-coupling factor transport system ATP-binding protein
MAPMSVSVDRLTVQYPGRADPALTDASLAAADGEIVGVTGRTGAGKSTLALALAGFIPRVVRAKTTGSVTVDGVDALASDAGTLLGRCGIVFSSPADQLSGSKLTVREELAFGLENLGVPRAEMDPRIDDAMSRLGIVHLAARDPGTLSGGEQQRVAIAGLVVMGPRVLILDEPTAELDPAGTAAVGELLAGLAGNGTTIVCVEQTRTILARCDRVVTLEAGRIVDAAIPRPQTDPVAWTVGSGRAGVSVAIEGLGYRYPGGIDALDDVTLDVARGESVAIVGANGSGKTTLAKHLIGLLRPTAGVVRLDGVSTKGRTVGELAQTVGFAFQDPGDQLFERSVGREVSFGPRQLGRSPAETAAAVEGALSLTGLGSKRDTNPYDLARPLRKLVTLAGVLAMDPALLVLDEPTTGQDPEGTERVGRIVEAMQGAGRTVIAITHELAFAERWFDRVVVMDAGRVVEDRRRPGA